MVIAVFCNEVKGKSMLAFCGDLDRQYKTAFVLEDKLREAMASRAGSAELQVRVRVRLSGIWSVLHSTDPRWTPHPGTTCLPGASDGGAMRLTKPSPNFLHQRRTVS
jgi:hypothetical protein